MSGSDDTAAVSSSSRGSIGSDCGGVRPAPAAAALLPPPPRSLRLALAPDAHGIDVDGPCQRGDSVTGCPDRIYRIIGHAEDLIQYEGMPGPLPSRRFARHARGRRAAVLFDSERVQSGAVQTLATRHDTAPRGMIADTPAASVAAVVVAAATAAVAAPLRRPLVTPLAGAWQTTRQQTATGCSRRSLPAR